MRCRGAVPRATRDEWASAGAKLKTCDTDLEDQTRRAATSVALNIAEGNQRQGRDRKHHFRVALGSAGEVRAHSGSGWPSVT